MQRQAFRLTVSFRSNSRTAKLLTTLGVLRVHVLCQVSENEEGKLRIRLDGVNENIYDAHINAQPVWSSPPLRANDTHEIAIVKRTPRDAGWIAVGGFIVTVPDDFSESTSSTTSTQSNAQSGVISRTDLSSSTRSSSTQRYALQWVIQSNL